MIINHNLNAMNAQRNMSSLNVKQGKSMEKLNSGLRINKASDDAAGLAISEKMRSQIRGLNQSSRNAQDGVSMIQTAEGAMSEIHEIGQRMRELAVQSANGTYTDEERNLINQEFTSLKKEIDRIAYETEFNGSNVLDGSKSGKIFEAGQGGSKAIGGNGMGGAEIKSVFSSVKQKEVEKIGEGTFEIRIYVGGNNNFHPELKQDEAIVELRDNSKFNEQKEYVMDSKKINMNGGAKEVELAGAKIHINDLKAAGIGNIAGKNGGMTFTNKIKEKVDGIELQIGANEKQLIGFDIDYMRSRELGLGGILVDNVKNANEAIKRVEEAISRVSTQRSNLGSIQNRLEHTISSVDNTAENLQASESRIRDVDMAKEMMSLTKLNVLQQASQAMLAQANQAPQQILSLLK